MKQGCRFVCASTKKPNRTTINRTACTASQGHSNKIARDMLFTSKSGQCSPQHKGLVCRRPGTDNRKVAARLPSTLHEPQFSLLDQHNFKRRKPRQWAAHLHSIYGGWSKQDFEGKGSCYTNCWLLNYTEDIISLAITRNTRDAGGKKITQWQQ